MNTAQRLASCIANLSDPQLAADSETYLIGFPRTLPPHITFEFGRSTSHQLVFRAGKPSLTKEGKPRKKFQYLYAVEVWPDSPSFYTRFLHNTAVEDDREAIWDEIKAILSSTIHADSPATPPH